MPSALIGLGGLLKPQILTVCDAYPGKFSFEFTGQVEEATEEALLMQKVRWKGIQNIKRMRCCVSVLVLAFSAFSYKSSKRSSVFGIQAETVRRAP